MNVNQKISLNEIFYNNRVEDVVNTIKDLEKKLPQVKWEGFRLPGLINENDFALYLYDENYILRNHYMRKSLEEIERILERIKPEKYDFHYCIYVMIPTTIIPDFITFRMLTYLYN